MYQFRAHSDPKMASTQDIHRELKKLEQTWNDYVRAAYLNVSFGSGEYVYPSSLRFSINLPGAEGGIIQFQENYSWEMMMAYNQDLVLTKGQFDQGVAKYGETYWDERFMARKTTTLAMLDICLTVASYGVPFFRERYKVPQGLQTTARIVGNDMVDLLGDLWRILLFNWCQHRQNRLLEMCWYQR